MWRFPLDVTQTFGGVDSVLGLIAGGIAGAFDVGMAVLEVRESVTAKSRDRTHMGIRNRDGLLMLSQQGVK